ncbi:MAG: hypothetical protein OEM27_03835 [Nitrospinota bacterium]|nr:hypothetical protein [Nitrospinota bacterium]
MKARIFLLQLVLIVGFPAYAAAGKQDACEYFFLALKAVPHDIISRSEGAHQSLWDRKQYDGCEVQFVTDDTLLAGSRVPDFDALQGSEMYRRGWRVNNSIGADGPGTGIFGIEKKSVLCLVRHDQPAYLDDDGTFVQSETLSITVQCRQK